MKLDLKPNPEFLKSVPAKHRRKWAEALLTTKRKQARGRMVAKDGAWCCLMVAHDAFGGTPAQRNETLPFRASPFAKAMGGYANPQIERVRYASTCNDVAKATFVDIAKLIYPQTWRLSKAAQKRLRGAK